MKKLNRIVFLQFVFGTRPETTFAGHSSVEQLEIDEQKR